MSDDYKQLRNQVNQFLWEVREGQGVIGVNREKLSKVLETWLSNFDDLIVIEEYAKELGWDENMNTTAALYVKDRAKKAGDEIAELAHPEFGDIGRLQEEIHDFKKEVARVQARESEAVMQSERDANRADKNAAEVGKLRDLLSKLIGDTGPDLDAYLDGHVEVPDVGEIKKEVEWLRYYRRNVYQCLGAGVDDVNTDIRRSFVREKGIDALPKQERTWHLEYEDEHKRD